MKPFILKLNLSGPPGVPITTFTQQRELITDPLPGWNIIINGGDFKVQHVRQNLDTGEIELWLGSLWTEADHYQAKSDELKQQGWIEVKKT